VTRELLKFKGVERPPAGTSITVEPSPNFHFIHVYLIPLIQASRILEKLNEGDERKEREEGGYPDHLQSPWEFSPSQFSPVSPQKSNL